MPLQAPSCYTGRRSSSLPAAGWRCSPLWPQDSPAEPTLATGKLGEVAAEPEPLGDISHKMYLLSGRGRVGRDLYSAAHKCFAGLYRPEPLPLQSCSDQHDAGV